MTVGWLVAPSLPTGDTEGMTKIRKGSLLYSLHLPVMFQLLVCLDCARISQTSRLHTRVFFRLSFASNIGLSWLRVGGVRQREGWSLWGMFLAEALADEFVVRHSGTVRCLALATVGQW